MNAYDPSTIEKRWREVWYNQSLTKRAQNAETKKFYCLVEFPYPSGEGLHVGHTRSYTALDIVVRKRRMEGYDVLFPMGWDAFGLPAENYAIKTGTHPRITTEKNVANFKRQLQAVGLSFDWDTEINTTDPKYYKWTQWIFLQFFKKGLAYKKQMNINWCPSCNVGLANEEVVDGKCDRCGNEVVHKERAQWMLAITKYAQRLIDDLQGVNYPERVKKQQIDWIGKSEGALIPFKIENSEESIEVFTTRPDTLYGVTFLVLAPEHPLVEKITTPEKKESVYAYIESAKKKSDIERADMQKEKTGEWTGAYAIHPATNEKIPVWIADYVLVTYGKGAIMAVPAHDQRDFAFAKKHNLPIKEVIKNPKEEEGELYEGEGIVIHSGEYDGMQSTEASKVMTEKFGKEDVQYKLRDWVFSRQRYWGEPIPLVFCQHCADELHQCVEKPEEISEGEWLHKGWIAVEEKDLPIVLPELEAFRTTDNGDSPLALVDTWVNIKCPRCGGDAKRETDTMPQWAGSSWYYLRYVDPHNDEIFADKEKLNRWIPVDWYNGGMEHTTLHLLYSRFWHKFLYDCGFVSTSEPYAKRTSHGLILGEGGEKMSKSRGNVVNPDDMVNEFGADAFRMYQMFMGPFEDSIPWSKQGILGTERFLKRVWNLQERVKKEKIETPNIHAVMQKTIKKVSEDIEDMKFNTAVSSLMVCVRELEKEEAISQDVWEDFLKILSPFAPFITQELWSVLGKDSSLAQEIWPNAQVVEETRATIAIQINGKTRGTIECTFNESQENVLKIVLDSDIGKRYCAQGEVKKVFFVQNKIINIIIG